MSLGVLIGIAVLGGAGAAARFLVDGAVAARVATELPLGTLAVNLTGSLALGVIAGATTDADALRLVATGLLGSYTTFSTWTLESQRLGEEGEGGLGLLNVGLSLALGVALAWVGLRIGARL